MDVEALDSHILSIWFTIFAKLVKREYHFLEMKSFGCRNMGFLVLTKWIGVMLLVVSTALARPLDAAGKTSLRRGFYTRSCPNVEEIVYLALRQELLSNPSAAPGILRLAFHDCFVRGCDASVLLESVGDDKAEMEGLGVALRGLDAVGRIKSVVEAHCPATVSCADILQFAARDSVVMNGGPFWAVEGGRRDGSVSLASEAGPPNLPVGFFNATQTLAIFEGKGFTKDEMVTLSGAHTIGQARCVTIQDRFAGEQPDPTLNPALGKIMLQTCGVRFPDSIRLNMDITTPYQFDNAYFSNLEHQGGLFTSDQSLFTFSGTRDLVKQKAHNQTAFFVQFAHAMLKLSRLQVLTGQQGEIRLNCSRVNTAMY